MDAIEDETIRVLYPDNYGYDSRFVEFSYWNRIDFIKYIIEDCDSNNIEVSIELRLKYQNL